MLLDFDDGIAQMVEDVGSQVQPFTIHQELDAVLVIPGYLIRTFFNRDQATNKNFEQKFVRNFHVLHFSKVIILLK